MKKLYSPLLFVLLCGCVAKPPVRTSGYFLELHKNNGAEIIEDATEWISKWDVVSVKHKEIYSDGTEKIEELVRIEPKKK